MVIDMKAILEVVLEKVMVNYFMEMVIDMKENIEIMLEKEKEN